MEIEIEKDKKNRYGFDFTPIGLDIKTFEFRHCYL